jgi:PhzF family phenazine biosynthesis protein
MRQIPFCVVDAFTDKPFQGNPAGVFFDDRAELSADDCKQLCAEVSLESAFVLPATGSDADFRLRYFTGVTEVPLCGHASVAALAALVDAARVKAPATVRVQTNVGVMAVDARIDPSGRTAVTLHQNSPRFGEPLPEEWTVTLADALGIASEKITDTGLSPQIISTGTPWLLVPVVDRDAVDNNQALENASVISHLSRQTGTFGIYLFTPEKENDSLTVWSRCFCPVADLPEDPVTGSASGCLGSYLAEHGILSVPQNGAGSLTAYQGFAGKRGGTAHIQVTRTGDDWHPAVTGTALITAAGMFTLP